MKGLVGARPSGQIVARATKTLDVMSFFGGVAAKALAKMARPLAGLQPRIRGAAFAVERDMRAGDHDSEIVQVVVESVAVLVMDVFGAKKRATQEGLHDKAMFESLLTASPDFPVSVSPNPADMTLIRQTLN